MLQGVAAAVHAGAAQCGEIPRRPGRRCPRTRQLKPSPQDFDKALAQPTLILHADDETRTSAAVTGWSRHAASCGGRVCRSSRSTRARPTAPRCKPPCRMRRSSPTTSTWSGLRTRWSPTSGSGSPAPNAAAGAASTTRNGPGDAGCCVATNGCRHSSTAAESSTSTTTQGLRARVADRCQRVDAAVARVCRDRQSVWARADHRQLGPPLHVRHPPWRPERAQRWVLRSHPNGRLDRGQHTW